MHVHHMRLGNEGCVGGTHLAYSCYRASRKIDIITRLAYSSGTELVPAEGLDPAASAMDESTPILTERQNGISNGTGPPIPPKKPPSDGYEYKVYPGRFYVLIAFALLAGQQALSWMTFGTIPNETFKHFGLTDDEITLLSGTYSSRSVQACTCMVESNFSAPPTTKPY